MNGTLFALLGLGLAFGAVLAFGLWQLWVLRRDRRKSAAQPRKEAGSET